MRVAAVDCGTNATRLLVAEVSASGADEITRELVITRMGECVDRTGMISEGALQRVGEALRCYTRTCTDLGVERIGVLATSAARDASNVDEVVALVEGAVGVTPLVLSGTEEAAATHSGAVAGVTAPAPALVVDIGGGSTEFAIEHDGQLVTASADIGSVRLTERVLAADPPSPRDVAAAVRLIEEAIAPLVARLPGSDVASLVTVGGTALTLAALHRGLDDPDDRSLHDARLDRAVVDQLAENLVFAPASTIAELAPVIPGREDVIGAGALLLSRVLALTGAQSMVVSRNDLLDDVVRRLAEGSLVPVRAP